MKLALGTVQFGMAYGVANTHGQVSQDSVKDILALARSAQVDTLDTAIAYGDSESRLGDAGVNGFALVTKLPAIQAEVSDVGGWVRQQVKLSMRRLRVERLYGVLLHRSEQWSGCEAEAMIEALVQLKSDGMVRKIGVSIYSPNELEAVTRRGGVDLVQAPVNVLDRRLQNSGWLARLKAQNVEIHARSVFLQGLLLMPEAAMPERFSSWRPIWRAWHQWLEQHPGVSAVQACIGFVAGLAGVDKVIVGVDSRSQLQEILVAAQSFAAIPVCPDWACEDERLLHPSNWDKL